MDPETEEIIKKQMEGLPTEVRNLFNDAAFNNKILSVGQKNGLNTEEIAALKMEIYLVLIGLVHQDEFGDALEESLKIDSIKLDNIVNDVKEQIFRGIMEKLEDAYENTTDEKIAEEENTDWENNINFILSGGDYSAFVENPKNSPLPEYPSGGGGQTIPPRLSTTPEVGNNIKTPTLQEIKDKLALKQ